MFDWIRLFKEARLDPARFSPTSHKSVPPMAFDAQMTWTGTYAEGRPERIRVEAAAWQGKPVFFDVSGEWSKPDESSDYRPSFLSMVLTCMGVFLLAGTVLVARHNLRMGRGDKKGATTIAVVVFFSNMSAWFVRASHAANQAEFGLLIRALMAAGFFSGLLWLGYLATEPYARKQWPDSLISWNRLLSGRFRDPLVASHVLAGFATFSAGGVILTIARRAISAAPVVAGRVENLSSASSFLAALASCIQGAVSPAIAVLVFVVVLRMVLRVVWIADLLVAVVLVFTGIAVDYTSPVHFAVTAGTYFALYYGIFWALRRFGLVALVAWELFNALIILAPPVPLDSWFQGGLVCYGIIIAVAGWALWVILAAQGRQSSEAAV
jgi:hypothetical protein